LAKGNISKLKGNISLRKKPFVSRDGRHSGQYVFGYNWPAAIAGAVQTLYRCGKSSSG